MVVTMKWSVTHKHHFFYFTGALVMFPLVLTAMTYTEYWLLGEPGAFNTLLFLPLSVYYSPPALIFQGSYFVTHHGVGPSGLTGIGITIIFYTLIACIISILLSKKSS